MGGWKDLIYQEFRETRILDSGVRLLRVHVRGLEGFCNASFQTCRSLRLLESSLPYDADRVPRRGLTTLKTSKLKAPHAPKLRSRSRKTALN